MIMEIGESVQTTNIVAYIWLQIMLLILLNSIAELQGCQTYCTGGWKLEQTLQVEANEKIIFFTFIFIIYWL